MVGWGGEGTIIQFHFRWIVSSLFCWWALNKIKKKTQLATGRLKFRFKFKWTEKGKGRGREGAYL